ncbi:uncharacterized protein LOC123685322 [Harmonia axyridis]|uniref:uncharacterized protein LOC123685322 n=1 Tax=Harmonia axyridis TaxID=115357 RepID=UPI001E27517B|nr:uncharacterized protein LOC123685322 [Harmonia axyridis]
MPDREVEEITLKQLLEEIKNSKKEVKNCISASESRLLLEIQALKSRNEYLERESADLKERLEKAERILNKNNVLVFGLKRDTKLTSEFLCCELNKLLKTNIETTEISDCYALGREKNCPRQENNRLRSFLLKARANSSEKSYIKGNRLVVGQRIYDLEELDSSEEENRPNSAPSTPAAEEQTKPLEQRTDYGLIDSASGVATSSVKERLAKLMTPQLATQKKIFLHRKKPPSKEEYIEKCTSVISAKKKNQIRKDYVTPSIMKVIDEKQKLFNRVKREPNNSQLKSEYSKLKNKLQRLIKEAKTHFFEKCIKNNEKDSKALWDCVKRITNYEKPDTNIKHIKNDDEEIIESGQEMCDLFNDYYSRLGESYANEIIAPADFTEEKILKVGIVKPLYKGGDRSRMQNYRPITLVSNLGKILEKLIKVRMETFINKHKIISDNQFGFRKGMSTENAIKKVTDIIYKNIDRKIPTLAVVVDLAKAFDTVCHDRLLEKLENFGFRGKVLNLLRSYLSDRIQIVHLNGKYSESNQINFGVPQGTVLGPLLFILYINSLFRVNNKGEIIGFADDTMILFHDVTWKNLKKQVCQEFETLTKWFRLNKLTINISKTKYITFASNKKGIPDLGDLNFDDQLYVAKTHSTRYLGVVIDEHLKWDEHITYVSRKLRGILYRFKYIMNYVNSPKHLQMLYESLVQPQLSYGIIGWGGVFDTHKRIIDVLQRNILKVMYKKKITFSSDSIYSLAKVLDIRQIFAQRIISHIKQNKISIIQKEHKYPTRAGDDNENYERPRAEKRIGQRCSEYIAARLYPIVPKEIKEINNKNKFNKELKRWLIEQDRTEIHKIINST